MAEWTVTSRNGVTPEEYKQQQFADAAMKKFLADYGLEALSGRLWDYIVKNGVDDENRLMLWIAEQPEYKKRFAAMEALQEKGRAISPAQYIQLERNYAQVMRENGIPESFFDATEDFTKLIANEVSPNELQARVQEGYKKVANADPRVREQFARFFGVDGDTALAAFFMDPERALPKLEAAAASAAAAAAADTMNFSIGLNEATRLAQMGVTYEQAMQGFQKMNLTRDLFEQSIGDVAVGAQAADQTDLAAIGMNMGPGPGNVVQGDVTGSQGKNGSGLKPSGPARAPVPGIDPADYGTDAETELGIAYTFGTDGKAQTELARRLAQRRAAVGAEVQGDTITRDGRGGLGAAD